MFSSTIKRLVATLGVVAGLLAGAVPASAAVTASFLPQAGVTADAGSGDDRARAVGLRADSNEVAVEGYMDYTDDDVGIGGQ